MKFFNWVHKRFHHPIPKDHDHDDFGDVNINKVEKHNTTASEQELVRGNGTQALLKKVVLVDALDGWKGGILAIGTFGFDPLKPLIGNNPREYLVLESEDDEETPDFSSDDEDDDDNSNDYNDVVDDSSEDEEANPLMFTALGHSFKDVDDQPCSDDEKKKVGRTTLADLFLADADQADMKKKKNKKVVMGKLGSAKVFSGYDYDDDDDYSDDDDVKYSKEQNRLRAKKGFSFAKKFIPKVKDEANPIKNIRRLMRRMLKRKIHPELLDVKSQKSDGQMAAGAIELIASTTVEKSASESASLLSMQGVPSGV